VYDATIIHQSHDEYHALSRTVRQRARVKTPTHTSVCAHARRRIASRAERVAVRANVDDDD
jgi:hypothetical protein